MLEDRSIPPVESVMPLTSDQPLTTCWCDGKGASGIRITRGGVKVYDHFCICDVGEQMKNTQDNANAVRRMAGQAATIDRLWEGVGVPRRFTNMRLHDSPAPDYALSMLYSTGVPYEESRLPESWFIHGSVGVGKTCLAVGYAYETVQTHLTAAKFVTLPAMMSEIRSCYDSEGPSEKKVLGYYKEIDMLILDDMGAEHTSSSNWLSDRLYQILGDRHDQLRPTVMTSNLSIPELANVYGDRITSRINEMCNSGRNVLHVEGRNLRE